MTPEEVLAAIAAKDARIAELEAEKDTLRTCARDWLERAKTDREALAAREAELTDLREGLYNALGGVSPSDAELIEVARLGRDARAELATMRGALEIERDRADHWDREAQKMSERLREDRKAHDAALATPPRRTPEGEHGEG
jgi:chromosome segregation ATPase